MLNYLLYQPSISKSEMSHFAPADGVPNNTATVNILRLFSNRFRVPFGVLDQYHIGLFTARKNDGILQPQHRHDPRKTAKYRPRQNIRTARAGGNGAEGSTLENGIKLLCLLQGWRMSLPGGPGRVAAAAVRRRYRLPTRVDSTDGREGQRSTDCRICQGRIYTSSNSLATWK